MSMTKSVEAGDLAGPQSTVTTAFGPRVAVNALATVWPEAEKLIVDVLAQAVPAGHVDEARTGGVRNIDIADHRPGRWPAPRTGPSSRRTGSPRSGSRAA